MSSCAVFNFSTEEDIRFELAFTGIDLTGKALGVTVRNRSTNAVQTTLGIGSGLTLIDEGTVLVLVNRVTAVAWSRGEYTADLIDLTAGAAERILAVRVLYEEPGRLPCHGAGRTAVINYSRQQAIVTAYRGATGPRGIQGPANTLTIGTVDTVAPGTGNSATITGTSPDQVLNLSLERGVDGIGAPTTPDILALTRYSSFVASLRAAGIGADPALFADFIEQTYLGRGKYVGASYTAMLAALSSGFTRSSTATYFDANGVMQTAAANAPRFDHDPATKTARGLLVEQGRTNLYVPSNSWTSGGRGSLSVSPEVGPDGGYMNRFIPDTQNGEHYVDLIGSYPAATSYVFSVYVKMVGTDLLFRLRVAGGYSATATFNLHNETSVAQTGASGAGMQPCGNGIYRCWMAFTSADAPVTVCRLQAISSAGDPMFTGNNTSGFDFWGPQMEVGPQPTSYIPTTTAAVARAAEGGVTVQSPSVEISPNAGTVLVDFTPDGVAGFADIAQIDAGNNNTRLLIRWNQARPSTPGVEVFAVYDGVTRVRFNVGPSLGTGQRARVALSFNGVDVFSAMNGVSAAPASLPEALLGLSRLIAPVSGTAGVATKSLRQASYFPTALTNAQLQALSSLTFGS